MREKKFFFFFVKSIVELDLSLHFLGSIKQIMQLKILFTFFFKSSYICMTHNDLKFEKKVQFMDASLFATIFERSWKNDFR